MTWRLKASTDAGSVTVFRRIARGISTGWLINSQGETKANGCSPEVLFCNRQGVAGGANHVGRLFRNCHQEWVRPDSDDQNRLRQNHPHHKKSNRAGGYWLAKIIRGPKLRRNKSWVLRSNRSEHHRSMPATPKTSAKNPTKFTRQPGAAGPPF